MNVVESQLYKTKSISEIGPGGVVEFPIFSKNYCCTGVIGITENKEYIVLDIYTGDVIPVSSTLMVSYFPNATMYLK